MACASISHGPRYRQRMDPVSVLKINIYEPGILADLTAQARATQHCRSLPESGSQGNAGILHCLSRGDKGELRESIEQTRQVRPKMTAGIVLSNLRAVLEAQLGDI